MGAPPATPVAVLFSIVLVAATFTVSRLIKIEPTEALRPE
jgi:hypothetical protein